MGAKLKVRQPLAKVEICLADTTHQGWLEQHDALIKEELNVKQVEFSVRADEYVAYTVLPDLKKLGPKLGKRLPLVKVALSKVDAAALLRELATDGTATLDLADGPFGVTSADVQVRMEAKPGWAAESGPTGVVVLSTELTAELVAEGIARDFVHTIQTIRKDLSCDYADRIEIGVVEAPELSGAVSISSEKRPQADEIVALLRFADYVKGETLATALEATPLNGVDPVNTQLGTQWFKVYVKVLKP